MKWTAAEYEYYMQVVFDLQTKYKELPRDLIERRAVEIVNAARK